MDHMDRSALLVLHNYNGYANDLVLESAAKLDEAAFVAQSSPSHGSVQHLLMHILAVEASFLAKCKGAQPPQKVFQVEAMTLAEIASELAQVRNLRLEYLMNISGEDLAAVIPITIGGQPLSLARWQLLAQSLLSSLHHRGELSIVMTGLGQPLPTLDIILQIVADSGQRWPFN
jgi:uncharacterized damage-inducible protein DinB